jgi:CysZ protein
MTPGLPPPLAVRGFFYPYRGLRFLFAHPRLLGYVAVPVAVNTLLYTALVWFAGSRFGRWVEALLPPGDAWYWSALSYALWLVFALVLSLIVVFTFTLVGNLLLEPFNDLLSEKVERAYTGKRLEAPFRLGVFWADAGRSFTAGLRRRALYGPGFVVLSVGSFFLPPLMAVLTVYVAFFLGWEYLDYPMDRWRFAFALKRKTAWRNLTAFLGFGAGAYLLLLIPLLNFLAIPVCVAGATLLFCDLRTRGRLPPAPGGGHEGTAEVPEHR